MPIERRSRCGCSDGAPHVPSGPPRVSPLSLSAGSQLEVALFESEEKWKRVGKLNDELEAKIRYYEKFYGELNVTRRDVVDLRSKLEESEKAVS